MSPQSLHRFALFGTGLTLTLSLALGGVLAPTASAAPLKDPLLAAKLTTVMSDSRVREASSGAAVMDVAGSSLLYGRNATSALTPASNTKLFTAAAAMATLGPSFRFKTEVIRRAKLRNSTLVGNLYLKGYGDPTSMQSDYSSLARQVRATGIRTVTGKLAVDTSYFDAQAYNPNWSTGYADAYYAAQIRPLTIAPDTDYDSGSIVVNYRPGARGRPASITTTPTAAARSISLRNLTTTGTGSTNVSVSRAYNSPTITLRGSVKSGSTGGSARVSVNRPDLVAAAVFRDELAKAGVRVVGPTTPMTTPATVRKRVAVDYSIPLSQLLVPFLKLSNNMHAETLTKTMGRVEHGSGSWTSGLAVTRSYLTSMGVPMTGVRMVDGSGLTRNNRITPLAMVTVLTKVQRQSWFKAYYDALPIAADPDRMVGGSMRSRLVGTKAAENAHAKTGSLTGVTALSGYVTGANRRLYAFSMISNYRSVSPRPVENTLVSTLAGWN